MATKIMVTAVKTKKEGIGSRGAWKISEVTVSGGNRYDTFDAFEEGKEYEVDIVPNKDPKYADNIRHAKKGGDPVKEAVRAEQTQQAVAKAETKDQRITMLSCIGSAAQFYQHRQGTEQQVIAFAKQLFSVAMSHQEDSLPF